MKIYIRGEAIDDGRIPRDRRDIDGWYRGDTIHDNRVDKYPTWSAVAVITLLCLLVVWLCSIGVRP